MKKSNKNIMSLLLMTFITLQSVAVVKATGTSQWIKEDDKWFYEENGVISKGWRNINKKWFYLNNNGAMATDWVLVDGKWYYLNSNGEMQIGWLNYNGSWFYLDKNTGEMVVNQIIEGYYIDADGKYVANNNNSNSTSTDSYYVSPPQVSCENIALRDKYKQTYKGSHPFSRSNKAAYVTIRQTFLKVAKGEISISQAEEIMKEIPEWRDIDPDIKQERNLKFGKILNCKIQEDTSNNVQTIMHDAVYDSYNLGTTNGYNDVVFWYDVATKTNKILRFDIRVDIKN